LGAPATSQTDNAAAPAWEVRPYQAAGTVPGRGRRNGQPRDEPEDALRNRGTRPNRWPSQGRM